MNRYAKIIEHFGIDAQQRKFEEEVFELQKAITEYEIVKDNKVLYSDSYLNKCYEHIVEEFADVLCLLKQFRNHYKIDKNLVASYLDFKLDRTINFIDNE